MYRTGDDLDTDSVSDCPRQLALLSCDQGDDSDSGEEPDDVSDQQSMNLLGSPSLSVDIYESEFLRSLVFFGLI